MKRLVTTHGQHFLRDPHLIAELVGHSNLRKNDTVLDIGAGSGAITAVLSKRVAVVVAYENDAGAFEILRRNLQNTPNVTLHHRDFLTAELPGTPYKVFANIPFHLSSPIVHRLVEAELPPKAIYLIVQKQFARKLLADNRSFTSQFGASIAPWWSVRIRRPLKKTDFWPHPAVDTVLLEMKQRSEPLLAPAERDRYQAFITKCFTDQTYFTKAKKGMINPEKRPSELSAEQWTSLYTSQ